jgi:single-stranded-DNA-specific exonuclease
MSFQFDSILPIHQRPTDGKSVLHAIARARGCTTEAEIEDFYSPQPHLNHPVGRMEDFHKAEQRIRRAINGKETVVVFGDYDVDGVTSTSQMSRFLKGRGVNVTPYIPDRLTEDYGLTLPSAKTCLTKFAPTLLITVDCGSLSHQAIDFLQGHGVDVIVLDHHEIDSHAAPNPALAHINPSDGTFSSVQKICASALVFFFCDALISAWGEQWPERDRQLILAGIGTLCDVMPLVGLNRSLVKHSLELLNGPHAKETLPGIVALMEATQTKTATAYVYGFVIGPCLNSAGRIDHALNALKVVEAESVEEAMPAARALAKLNSERKDLQKRIEVESEQMAQDLLAENPGIKVLVLAKADWHPGVIGIVASRLKEKFDRPVFICGESEGFWKGSGRSVPGFNLGEMVHGAVRAGVLEGGGGHGAAAGIRLRSDLIPAFNQWIEANADFDPFSFCKTHEVIGRFEWTEPRHWLGVFSKLAPFGMGNPTPQLLAADCTLQLVKEKTKKADNSVWALEGEFKMIDGKQQSFVWSDVGKARNLWNEGAGQFDCIVKISESEWNGRTFLNLNVEDCAPSELPMPWEIEQRIVG